MSTPYLRGAVRIPHAVVLLAKILAGGELVQGGEEWRGWIINRRGELVDPQGTAHTPASIQSWHWCAQQLQALRGEENQKEKVTRIRTGHDAHVITLEMHRRLQEVKANRSL